MHAHTHTHTHTHTKLSKNSAFSLVIMDEFRQGAKYTNAVRSLALESPIPLHFMCVLMPTRNF